MAAHYFAYGSNLKLSRMRERVPSAMVEGVALLSGYRLVWDKRGTDGTGKANLRADAEAAVWGVVYRLDTEHWDLLDVHEPGYQRFEVSVSWLDAPRAVATYLSTRTTDAPLPAAWYKRLVVEGAREHGLPEPWIRALEACPTHAPGER